MQQTLTLDECSPLVEGRHENPHHVLGPHEFEQDGRRGVAVRAYWPGSSQAWVIDTRHGHPDRPMRQVHPAGVFEAFCPSDLYTDETGPAYQLRIAESNGRQITMHDPYAFGGLLTDFDLYLIGEGTHFNSYERLGAHPREVNGVHGVNFAVWAPNAETVSVVGDFNGWDGRRHMLKKHIPSGIWEVFVPDLKPGTIYKYQLKRHGRTFEKSDPYGFAAELPPCTASIVSDLNGHAWSDAEWLTQRKEKNFLHQPLSIYEVHLGSWQKGEGRSHGWLNYRDLAVRLADYCQANGFTHVQLLPISEHPLTASWGYQTVGYFAVTSRYGTPQDFMYFVDYLHQRGLGVIIDWVPAHFPRDGHGLWQFDGTALYEHEDPRQGEHPDWGTMVFNYGRNEVRNFLISNALFWFDKYHVDGLRVDAVASMLYLDYSRNEGEWVPNRYGGRENLEAIELIKTFNEQVHERFPGALTIAEESTAWGGVSRPTYLGGLGFSLKWNMGWMNDTLRYMRKDPIHRHFHHDELTFSLIYAFHENFVLPLSHDEVVHGKRALLDQMPGDLWQRFANLRLLYGYMWSHPGKKLLFMGGDIAQWNEWNHDATLQWDLLQWPLHQGIQRLLADLNGLYRHEAALHELDFDGAGFEWIDCHDSDNSVLSYLRKSREGREHVIVACNFTPVPRIRHRLGVPQQAWYQEIMNTDSAHYGGSNLGNNGGVHSEPIPCHGRPFSVELTIPPLAAVLLKAM